MNWQNVRQHHPHRWVLVEATASHTEADRWVADELAVIDAFQDVKKAMSHYRELHHRAPQREFFVAHTDNSELTITVRNWIGIRNAR